MDGIQGMESTGVQGQASTAMLKKSLDFQADMASSLLAGSTQAAPLESPQRAEAMQAQGKGQRLNVTV
ncbi:MAG: putative motility protein [Desulfovibrionaceae bacterium]